MDMRRSVVVAKTVPSEVVNGSQNSSQEDPLKDEPYVEMNPAALPQQSMADTTTTEGKATTSLLPPPSSAAPIYEALCSIPMPSPSPSSPGSESLHYASRDMLEVNNSSWNKS